MNKDTATCVEYLRPWNQVEAWSIALRFAKRGLTSIAALQEAGVLPERPPENALGEQQNREAEHIRQAKERLKQRVADRIAAGGPGLELTQMFEDFGATSCDACKSLAAQMNVWGSKGCRMRYWTIVGNIKDRVNAMGWAGKLVNWGLDPVPAMVEKAIQSAEKKGF